MSDEKLPNILIFVPDEMRADTVSLAGKINPIIKSPNIDSVANDGVIFTKCFTASPFCVPSRCASFTGQYVHSGGHRSLYQMLEPHEENLFKFLKEKGYEVYWMGRNDLFNPETIKISVSKHYSLYNNPKLLRKILAGRKGNPFPIEHRLRKSFYYSKREEKDSKDFDFYTIQNAIEYLNSKPECPFCLYIALEFPHPPYTVEEPYFSMYDRMKVPAPIPPILEDKPEFMKIIHERYGLRKLTEEDFREIIATYYGMITRVDYQFGQVVDALKNIKEYDNTAIFFFADHGDYAGNYGLTEKWSAALQDCLVNVPLIVKIPKLIPIKKVFNDLVETIDIFPTIMNLAQINTNYTHFGKSLIPLITEKGIVHRDEVFSEGGFDAREPQCFEKPVNHPNDPLMGIYFEKTNIPKEKRELVTRSTMIRTENWKYILRNDAMEELYDLKNDPQEMYNLINDEAHIQTLLELRERMLRWYLATSDNPHWKRLRLP